MTKKILFPLMALGLACATLAGCETSSRGFNATHVPSITHSNGALQDQPVMLGG
jgi:uncharacterized lipoprotein YajG